MSFPSIEAEKQFYASLPRKRVVAGAILTHEGKFLLLKPNYKAGYNLPGGTVEADESPYEGCIREVWEELGLKLEKLSFLSVEFIPAEGLKPEWVNFLFHGGELTQEQVASLRPNPEELDGMLWVSREEARSLIPERAFRRLEPTLDVLQTGKPIYLEDGRKISG